MKFNLKKTALVLTSVGAINWGLTIFNFNIVEKLTSFVTYSMLPNIIYGIIGLSGAYTLLTIFKVIK